MTITNNDYVITMLSDGETWCSDARVLVIYKDKALAYGCEEMGWDESDTDFEDVAGEVLTQSKEWRMEEEGLVKHSVDAEFLLEFYLMSRELGLNTIVEEMIDGVRAQMMSAK